MKENLNTFKGTLFSSGTISILLILLNHEILKHEKIEWILLFLPILWVAGLCFDFVSKRWSVLYLIGTGLLYVLLYFLGFKIQVYPAMFVGASTLIGLIALMKADAHIFIQGLGKVLSYGLMTIGLGVISGLSIFVGFSLIDSLIRSIDYKYFLDISSILFPIMSFVFARFLAENDNPAKYLTGLTKYLLKPLIWIYLGVLALSILTGVSRFSQESLLLFGWMATFGIGWSVYTLDETDGLVKTVYQKLFPLAITLTGLLFSITRGLPILTYSHYYILLLTLTSVVLTLNHYLKKHYLPHIIVGASILSVFPLISAYHVPTYFAKNVLEENITVFDGLEEESATDNYDRFQQNLESVNEDTVIKIKKALITLRGTKDTHDLDIPNSFINNYYESHYNSETNEPEDTHSFTSTQEGDLMFENYDKVLLLNHTIGEQMEDTAYQTEYKDGYLVLKENGKEIDSFLVDNITQDYVATEQGNQVYVKSVFVDFKNNTGYIDYIYLEEN